MDLPLHAEQLQRQEQAFKRSRDAALSGARSLKEKGKESALSYGKKLYRATHSALTLHISRELEHFVAAPYKARRFAAAFPYLDQFKGAEHIATIALIAALDQLSRRQRLATFAQNIGAAVEKEDRLMELERRARVEMRHLMHGSGMSRSHIASSKIMDALGVYRPRWSDRVRLDVGLFLADAVVSSTELFKIHMHKVGVRQQRMLGPSDQALEFIQKCRVPGFTTTHSAMVCKPQTWHTLFGGGVLDNEDCLIRPPIHDAEDVEKSTAIYREADMGWLLKVVNHLQDTPLKVDGELVEIARTSWEAGFDGLWPCSRAPMELPPELGGDPTDEELKARNRLAVIAHRDREQNKPRRIKVERALQQAEAIKGRTIWQAYHCDHRGRIYSGNRYVTHQGPDYEKAWLSFEPKPVGPDGIDWILKAAAGHYGLSQNSWSERLEWGEANTQRMLAAAEDPLDRLELWRSAKDPWQFLQLCRGLKEALETGSTGVPIRFDQTTSGCGILAALVRDKTVGRLCNLYGSTRRDLYTKVAEAVQRRLQEDLELGDDHKKLMAEVWLDRGITRSLVKGPVLAVPYGGSYQSLTDKLVADLDEHLGYVPLEEFTLRVGIPSRYLASHLWAELKDAVLPVNEVKGWLKRCCRLLMRKQHPLRWNSPMGFPMLANERESTVTKVATFLYGKRISVSFADQPEDMPLSYTAANKALPANFTHSFDAALVHAVVSRAADQSIPLLTNHDCFAVHPCHAGQVHRLLLSEFQQLYRTDWLGQWKQEVQAGTGVSLPEPPMVNDLDVGLIGSNPYLFS